MNIPKRNKEKPTMLTAKELIITATEDDGKEESTIYTYFAYEFANKLISISNTDRANEYYPSPDDIEAYGTDEINSIEETGETVEFSEKQFIEGLMATIRQVNDDAVPEIAFDLLKKTLIAKVFTVTVREPKTGLFLSDKKAYEQRDFPIYQFENGLILLIEAITNDSYFENLDDFETAIDNIIKIEEPGETGNFSSKELLKSMFGSIREWGSNFPEKLFEFDLWNQ